MKKHLHKWHTDGIPVKQSELERRISLKKYGHTTAYFWQYEQVNHFLHDKSNVLGDLE